MRAFIAVKFHEDRKNRKRIEALSEALESSGAGTIVMARDHEQWGLRKLAPEELMKLTFSEIDKSDVLVAEFSEKGIGVGIEAGYARAKEVPIVGVAETGSDISETLQGIASDILFYGDSAELATKLKPALARLGKCARKP